MYNVKVYDWHAIFELLGALTWVALVGVVLVLLTHLITSLSKQNKQRILIVFMLWAVASSTVAGFKAYIYLTHQRRVYQSFQAQ